MRAGDLRHQMAFQTRSASQDSIGGQSPEWSTNFTAWVAIEPLSGRELFAAQAVNSEVTHTIKARYMDAFSDPKAVAAMRGIYNGRVFDLHVLMNVDERNREVQILASEGLTDG